MKTHLLRAFLLVTVFAAALCFLMGTIEAASDQDTARKEYADKVRATYNYRFGTDKPTVPGNASVEGDDFVQPGAFPNANYCGHCHQEAYHQWRQALHSNSFRTPFYRTSVNILIRTKGIEFSRHCDSCHNPIAVLAGGLTQNSQVDRSIRSRRSHLHHVPLHPKSQIDQWQRRLCHGNPGSDGGRKRQPHSGRGSV